MNAIEVKNVKKGFGKLEVLKDVTLKVQPGEIYTLLGENGAGKSTLINILTTLSQADAGAVKVMGLDPIRDGQQVRRLISLNAQTMTLDENFTGEANLRLIAKLRGVADVDVAIKEISQRLELSGFIQRKVNTYSGGMRRRLDIAMSLLGSPKLVFLDEPTTGVDPKNRLALWQLIREMRANGQTVFLTTQYLDEADALSDHIAFIHDGRIVKVGTPTEIKRQVTTTYSLKVAEVQRDEATNLLENAAVALMQRESEFELDEIAAKQGLPILLANGIQVQHFNLNETKLETVFLNLTQQEVNHANH